MTFDAFRKQKVTVDGLPSDGIARRSNASLMARHQTDHCENGFGYDSGYAFSPRKNVLRNYAQLRTLLLRRARAAVFSGKCYLMFVNAVMPDYGLRYNRA